MSAVRAPSPELLDRPRRIHIVGVGGTGMSAIAEVLSGAGHQVSGSDLQESAPLVRLRERGLRMYVGHDGSQIGDAELVSVSTAVPETNPEVVAARAAGIPVLSRSELLSAMTSRWRSIAVAGTHGKTTTSAMLAAALIGAGLEPGYLVGGDLRDLGRGAAVGGSDLLVVEADESDGTFAELDAAGVIVTNVEPDHLEHYGGFDALESAFDRFLEQCAGPRLVCIDDPGAARLVERARERGIGAVSYGTDPGAEFRLTEPRPTPLGIDFRVVGPGGVDVEVRLRQPGMHNARNAVAALAMAVLLGADAGAAAEALSAFGGVGRRFEVRGEADGIRVVDDYAHLPTEVSSALEAARSQHAQRLVAVFQPHRYSRTDQLWSTFTDAFVAADLLVVTGIYAAGEAPRPGVSGRLIADDVGEHHPELDVRYVEDLDEALALLVAELRPGDLCLLLGAGDLTHLPDRLLPALEARSSGPTP